MTTADSRPLALLYTRVSTERQTQTGASLDAQEVELVALAERKGYSVEVVREESRSAKSLRRREALAEALTRLDRGDAQALFAWRVDRLARSVGDFAYLLDRAKRRGWRVVVADADVDTNSASGGFLTNILAAAAQYEREIIIARTKDALAQRRREGKRLGRPSQLPVAVVGRVVALRGEGASLRAIADRLNSEEVPTAHKEGAKWHASTVAKVLAGQDAQALAA